MIRRTLNFDALLRIAILWGFVLLFSLTLLLGKARLFVHPRIDKYMVFAAIFLFIVSLFSFEDLGKRRPARVNLFRYTPFVVALALALMVQAIPIDASSALADRWLSSEAPIGGNTSIRPIKGVPELQEGILQIVDENYSQLMNDIQMQPNKYIGLDVEFIGFVLKRNSFASDEMLVGRFVMWCCVADVVVAGLICKTDDVANIEAFSWLRITGKIAMIQQGDKEVPMVIVTSHQSIAAPENEYVYP